MKKTIPVAVAFDMRSNTDLHSLIKPGTIRADLIKNASAIAWDELPMANIAAVECADEICRRITGIDKPFGGIPLRIR